MKSAASKVVLCRSKFGEWKNPSTESFEAVEKFTWKTVNRLEVSLITFGARLVEIIAPNRDGNPEDILIGFKRLEEILCDGKFNFGSTLGPVASTIKNNEFCLNGKFYRVGRNKHQAGDGFSRINWSPFVDGTDVILSHTTDSSTGFPGIVLVQILFSVKSNNTLFIKTTARSNQATPIDVATRLNFNLSSHEAGGSDLVDHLVTIKASKFLERNSDGLHNKTASDVNETDLGVRSLKRVGEIIQKSPDGTIDCLYIIDQSSAESNRKLQFVARVIHPPSGRVLEIQSNQPTLRFSTCAEFPEAEKNFENQEKKSEINLNQREGLSQDQICVEKETESFENLSGSETVSRSSKKSSGNESFQRDFGSFEVTSKEDAADQNLANEKQNSGISMTCSNFPNAVNHQRRHPTILLRPGEVYENLLLMKFGIHVRKKPQRKLEACSHFPITIPIVDKFPVNKVC